MNEFTKEELEIILAWSQELCMEYGIEGSKEEQALDRKLQSMLDNYCEHTEKSFECSECGSWACKVCQNRMVENE